MKTLAPLKIHSIYAENFRDSKGQRIPIKISDKDYKAVMRWRGLGFKGTVTELRTGKALSVYGAPCNLEHCNCAIIVRRATRP